LGSMVGAPGLGGTAGKTIAQKLGDKLVGKGAYADVGPAAHNVDEVVVNSLFANKPSPWATFASREDQLRLKHREYVSDLLSTTTSAVPVIAQYMINPGDPTLFPQTSGISATFELYQYLGFVAEIMTSTTMYSSTSVADKYGGGFDYDAYNSPIATLQAFLNNNAPVYTAAYNNVEVGAECATAPYNSYYVQTNTSAVSVQPVNLVYQFVLYLVTTNNTGRAVGVSYGDVYFIYDILLSKPVIPPFKYGYGRITLGGTSSTPGLVTATNPLSFSKQGSLARIYITGNILYFPDAKPNDVYMIVQVYNSNSAFTGGSTSCVNAAGFTAYNLLYNKTQYLSQATGGVVNVDVCFMTVTTPATVGTSVGLNSNLTTAGGSFIVDVIVLPLGNGVALSGM
jgi:hypothetical protein